MGIYVLGMHRSGTSALSRTLGLLVGYEGVRGATPSNSQGHWELPVLNHALEWLLRDVDSDWASPPFHPLMATDPELQPKNLRAVRDIVSSLGNGNWVLKDPRASLALDVLLSAPQPQPLAIATFRHPVAVANSIATRDGYQFEYGLALWEIYTRLLVEQLQNQSIPTLWVSYEGLLADSDATVERLSNFLSEAAGIEVKPEAKFQALASIQPEMQHHDADLAEAGLSQAQSQLLTHVRRLADGQTPGEFTHSLTRWARALIETRRPYARLERDNRYLTRRMRLVKPAFRAYDRARDLLGRHSPEDPFANYE